MAQEKLALKSVASDELKATLADLEHEYVQMKFDHTVSSLANPLEIRALRRDIARYKTELRGREVAAFTPEQVESRSKIRFRRRNNR